MIRLSTILFTLLFPLLTFGQNQQLMDSLSSSIKESPNDSILGNATHELGRHIFQFNRDSSLGISQGITAAMEEKLAALPENDARARYYYRILTTCYDDMASVYRERGDVTSAMKYGRLMLGVALKTSDKGLIAMSYYQLSRSYHNFGKPAQALEVLNKGFSIAEEINDSQKMGIMLNLLGNLNANQGDEEKALECYERAYAIHEANNFREGMAIQLGNLGSSLTTAGNYDMALTYLEDALAINRELENWSGEIINMYNIAAAYEMKKEYDNAWAYYQRGLKINDAHQNLVGRVYYLTAIGNLFLLREDIPKAREYGIEALELSKQLGYPEQIRNVAQVLRDVYKIEGNNGKALEMYELFIQMRDSIKNTSAQRAIIQSQYAKQAALDSAKFAQEQRITRAELATQEAELSIKKTQRNGLIIGLFLMVAFAVFILNRYRLSQRQKQIIAQQKELVEKKNQQVESSIKYAKRIQKSVLRTESELKELLPDSFVFYRPRDIVSGDFYWYTDVNGLVILAAVDCTGHGIPGAFMSMIGSTLLNKIVNENKVLDPGEILTQLHTGVVKALHQEKGDDFSQDGMDMTLCTIDHKKGIIEFAGAMNPLYLVQKGEFQEFKTDSIPIGGKKRPNETKERSFNTQSIPIEDGCSLYLFSDGYADQFGGEKDGKFGSSRFKQLFVDNQDKSMDEQLELVDAAFTEWKGDKRQLDDVLVIGVRV